MKYYVAPISNLHDVRIVPVEVKRSIEGRLVSVEAKTYSGRFYTHHEYLHDTKEDAIIALKSNVLEFRKQLDYSMMKALEEING